MNSKMCSIADIKQLAVNALVAHNTGRENAIEVADALIAAEIDGLGGHGLARLPSYCAQSASGKVNGHALPLSSHVAVSAVKVDAQHGFAYPALELAINELFGHSKKPHICPPTVGRKPDGISALDIVCNDLH